MTRAALIILAVALAGCSTAPTEREIIAAHELVGFDWCSPAQLHQCPMIRQGNEMFMLPIGGRVGGGGDVWNVRGATVDAFSEDG